MKEFVSAFDLLGNYRIIRDNGKPMDERRQLLQELVDKTGLPLGRILDKTKGMQDIQTLRFILSSMKTVRGAKDGKHAFNIVLFTPHH